MKVIRPIAPRDFPALVRFAHESGHGFTSLPKNDELLHSKIDRAEVAFRDGPNAKGGAGFLFVMEDLDSGEVLGTSGIEARVGIEDALYHYHLSRVVHSSRELDIHNAVDVLTLCNDYSNATEICTLFLTGDARARHNGYLLSRFRFLFIAQHAEYFADTVIAEMRGRSNEQGRSPFWGWLQKHFFSMDLADAVHRVGMGQKSFIAELMPRYPVYVSLLDDAAQATIGKVHEQTAPALKMLEREGFAWRGYIDPFDAGPTVEASRDTIATAARSHVYQVRIAALNDAQQYLITNTCCDGFRATLAAARMNGDVVEISEDTARGLDLCSGDRARVAAMESAR
ncbi:MAG: arginine N-succinyltransferase [Oceanococcus sp.]